MYSEGEHRYLKDLDWVNIVKSIRELKALSRVILNKYQQEILSFEKKIVYFHQIILSCSPSAPP